MAVALPGDTRPTSLRALIRLRNKYGRDSMEFRVAWKFFKAGYHAALQDFLDATGERENPNWYNEEPTLEAFKPSLGLRRRIHH